MSDARRYAVWPDPRSRSRSRALERLNSFHSQNLSPLPFTMAAGKWPLIFKLEHNIKIWSIRIFYICPSFCVTWLWGWQKPQWWLAKFFSSNRNEIWHVGGGHWVTHDGMLYGRNQGQGQGHSREVDRQTPTGLILSDYYQLLTVFLNRQKKSRMSCSNVFRKHRKWGICIKNGIDSWCRFRVHQMRRLRCLIQLYVHGAIQQSHADCVKGWDEETCLLQQHEIVVDRVCYCPVTVICMLYNKFRFLYWAWYYLCVCVCVCVCVQTADLRSLLLPNAVSVSLRKVCLI